jgi:hypothetical protein
VGSRVRGTDDVSGSHCGTSGGLSVFEIGFWREGGEMIGGRVGSGLGGWFKRVLLACPTEGRLCIVEDVWFVISIGRVERWDR